jgi:hypothetical protein
MYTIQKKSVPIIDNKKTISNTQPHSQMSAHFPYFKIIELAKLKFRHSSTDNYALNHIAIVRDLIAYVILTIIFDITTILLSQCQE